jgi:fused signal recognition particle receptor
VFDFLKKKIGGFIDGLTKKEAKPEEEPAEKIGEIALPEIEEKPPVPRSTAEEKKEKPAQPKERPKPEKAAAPPEPKKIPQPKPAAPAVPAQPKAAPQTPIPPEAPGPAPQIARPPEIAKPAEIHRPAPQKPAEAAPTSSFPKPEMKKEVPAAEAEKKRIRLGAISAIKGFITSEVEIKESDVKGMLENFELELLEADVDISVAGAIREELETKLVGSRTPRDKLHAFVGSAIKETLTDMITNEKAFDIVERVSACEKPAKLMFLGINGAGKTTTIAKVARLLMDSDAKVVLAAADTFRAAAIEQAAVHADRLGIKLIKRDYGSDPTSVAYDAVNYAKAHGIDAVLIDTAGRQDTNISLLNEMKKMVRVISPDLKIYIGESIAGNAIIEQITAFNREIGIDAVILTKLDCDPKGGTMLSINRATGIPIIYVGVGQAYSDLEKFDPARIVSRIVD